MSDRDWWMSVDPGTGGSGIGFWKGDGENQQLVHVINNLVGPAEGDWSSRARSQMMSLADTAVQYQDRIRLLVCEFPQIWVDNATAQAIAQKGDICKLAAMAGMFGEFARAIGAQTLYVPVNHWKGQLPKNIVEDRCRQILKDLGIKKPGQYIGSHGWDAVGLGLYHGGLFE